MCGALESSSLNSYQLSLLNDFMQSGSKHACTLYILHLVTQHWRKWVRQQNVAELSIMCPSLKAAFGLVETTQSKCIVDLRVCIELGALKVQTRRIESTNKQAMHRNKNHFCKVSLYNCFWTHFPSTMWNTASQPPSLSTDHTQLNPSKKLPRTAKTWLVY